MFLRGTPIKRKLVTIILLTTGVVLLVTCASFFAYEFLTFRQTTLDQISTIAEMVADTGSGTVLFENEIEAQQILDALKAERHVVAAAFYDKEGKLFVRYPASVPVSAFPERPGADTLDFADGFLSGFRPVVQGNNPRAGTLFIKADMEAMRERFRLYGSIALLVIAVSFLVAYFLSRVLQGQISKPILTLAETARAVSDRRDYSVRARKWDEDELGLLTDAFNHMLTQIQAQNRALIESAAHVRAVIDAALSAVVVTDASGVICDWNARAETLFGWKRAEALGQTIELILPDRYHGGKNQGWERFLDFKERADLRPSIELGARRRDGSVFLAELSVSPLKAGEVMTHCGFITDITERKEAEVRIQEQLGRLGLLNRITRAVGERQDLISIFHVMIDTLEANLPIDFGAVCLHDETARTLTVAGLGARSRNSSAGLDLVEGVRLEVGEDWLAACFKGGLVYHPELERLQVPLFRKWADAGFRSLVAAPLLVESKVFGVFLALRTPAGSFSAGDCEFIRQVSEHVALAAHQAQLYSALQQAYDDLRRTQQVVLQQERLRALGQMASGIAHDINNALSPVALYTESLLEKEANLSPRARDYLQTIQRAVEDVGETVSRMREFYRHREPQLALAPVHLNQTLKQVIDLTRARWSDMPQERGFIIRLETHLAEDLPPLLGSESEIRDALTNLILNAVDAMPEGGGLKVRTGSTDAESGSGLPAKVLVEVSDTGVGMDEETRRRCLEPFFTTKGERGTGLGLAMVYGMVQRHNAEIQIDSRPGQGTTVRLIFLTAPVPNAAVSREVTGLRPRHRLRILVIDDDPLLIRSLRDTLEGDGHLVTVADGGQAGIDAFNAVLGTPQRFSAVITDLGMPQLDGRRVATAIKSASPQTLLIMLSGWGHRMVTENDIPANVDRLLSKPPRLQELREVLANCPLETMD